MAIYNMLSYDVPIIQLAKYIPATNQNSSKLFDNMFRNYKKEFDEDSLIHCLNHDLYPGTKDWNNKLWKLLYRCKNKFWNCHGSIEIIQKIENIQ
jgi:hypothetical protein